MCARHDETGTWLDEEVLEDVRCRTFSRRFCYCKALRTGGRERSEVGLETPTILLQALADLGSDAEVEETPGVREKERVRITHSIRALTSQEKPPLLELVTILQKKLQSE